jgi:hypothetical protein
MEIWKDIPGYEGFYQASNLGRIKSLARIECRKSGASYQIRERILSTPLNTNGYPNVNLCMRGERRLWRVHRLIALAFLSSHYPLSHNEINHINGNKTDNRVENLERCSRSENGKHAHATGLNRGVKGHNHPMAKLTNAQAEEIRKKYSPFKYTMQMLAKEYGISDSNICGIIKNKRYAVR